VTDVGSVSANSVSLSLSLSDRGLRLGDGLRGFFVDDLDVDFELHFFGDGDAAGFEDGVEADAEVFAVDGGFGAEAGDGFAVGVLRDAVELDVEGDGLGYAADRDVAVDDVLAVVSTLATSISPSNVDLVKSLESRRTVPRYALNWPRTVVTIMCFTEKPTCV
jgi:hypothetical protein